MNLPEGILNPSSRIKYNLPPVVGKCLSDDDIKSSLEKPIWQDKQRRISAFDIAKPDEIVCIVVSDHTRRTAVNRILPVLLAGLKERGCSEENIFFLVASGIHRPPTHQEIKKILGESIANVFKKRIILHNADNNDALFSAGKTRRGHEVRLNKFLIEADKVIVTGAASYHYHAGFGGGRKSIVPGLAGRETIAYNHSLTLDPKRDQIADGVGPGILDGNPVSEEMFEAASLCKPDIIINTVLSYDGELAGVFCGDMDLAHRVACKMVEKYSVIKLPEKADIVIASAGNALNWVQSHKALYNAHRAVKSNGYVILEAPCPEGLGDEGFRHWIKLADNRAICTRLRKHPEILGQTALSTLAKSKNTILITKLNKTDAQDLGIETAPDIKTALDVVRAKLNAKGITDPSWCVIDKALYLLPVI